MSVKLSISSLDKRIEIMSAILQEQVRAHAALKGLIAGLSHGFDSRLVKLEKRAIPPVQSDLFE